MKELAVVQHYWSICNLGLEHSTGSSLVNNTMRFDWLDKWARSDWSDKQLNGRVAVGLL